MNLLSHQESGKEKVSCNTGMFLVLTCLGVWCPNISVSWPRVGMLGLGVALVWQSVADGWEPSRDILCKAPEGFEGLDLSKGSCGEVPSVAQGIPS
jgi:hypothetical protein